MFKNSTIWSQRNTTLHINFFVFTDHVKMHKMIDGNINVREFPET